MHYAIEQAGRTICERDTEQEVRDAAKGYFFALSIDKERYGFNGYGVNLQTIDDNGEVIKSVPMTINFFLEKPGDPAKEREMYEILIDGKAVCERETSYEAVAAARQWLLETYSDEKNYGFFYIDAILRKYADDNEEDRSITISFLCEPPEDPAKEHGTLYKGGVL